MNTINPCKVISFFVAISLFIGPLTYADIRLHEPYPDRPIEPREPPPSKEPPPPRENPVSTEAPVSSAPDNSPGHNSNHEVIAAAVLILLGVCLYHRCWEQADNNTVDVQPSRMTPEIPTNEYLRIQQR